MTPGAVGPLAIHQHQGEIELRGGEAPDRRRAISPDRFGLVPLHAPAEVVENPDVVLGIGRAFLGLHVPHRLRGRAVAAFVRLIGGILLLLRPRRHGPAKLNGKRKSEP